MHVHLGECVAWAGIVILTLFLIGVVFHYIVLPTLANIRKDKKLQAIDDDGLALAIMNSTAPDGLTLWDCAKELLNRIKDVCREANACVWDIKLTPAVVMIALKFNADRSFGAAYPAFHILQGTPACKSVLQKIAAHPSIPSDRRDIATEALNKQICCGCWFWFGRPRPKRRKPPQPAKQAVAL